MLSSVFWGLSLAKEMWHLNETNLFNNNSKVLYYTFKYNGMPLMTKLSHDATNLLQQACAQSNVLYSPWCWIFDTWMAQNSRWWYGSVPPSPGCLTGRPAWWTGARGTLTAPPSLLAAGRPLQRSRVGCSEQRPSVHLIDLSESAQYNGGKVSRLGALLSHVVWLKITGLPVVAHEYRAAGVWRSALASQGGSYRRNACTPWGKRDQFLKTFFREQLLCCESCFHTQTGAFPLWLYMS